MHSPYKLINTLEEEVKTNISLHPQITAFIQLFLRYLKEPRYQSPLGIAELSDLFKKFYQDLNVLVICIYTQSNSTKKQLISHCDYFNNNPKVFDYLLAIANYSASSIRLLKRTDHDALYQLRVFNYYKLITIFEAINLAELELFKSISLGDEVSLYDKLFRFDHKDTIYQEFLQDKLDSLRKLDLSFKHFIDHDLGSQDKLVDIIDNLQEEDLAPLQQNLTDMDSQITAFGKLKAIVGLNKNLIKLFTDKGLKSKDINNDLLLPSLIYLIIYKLKVEDLYLNFLFIKNFLNLVDGNPMELYQINLYLSYNPTAERSPLTSNKYKKSDILGYLNLSESQATPQEQSYITSDEFEFFTNDKDLVTYINQRYLNTGELHYYLTNFEAMIVYLSNMTISELLTNNETDLSSELKNKSILKYPIDKLVDEELLTHFQFPDGQLESEIKAKAVEEEELNRSRSSSLLNTISNKINETRSRSSSLRKENFPTLPSPTEDGEENSGFAMMRNILGRFGSASTAQEPNGEDETNSNVVSPTKRSNSLMNRISPSHSRTRSSSLENAATSLAHANKRNSITAKFTNGVSEFMTKLNQPGGGQPSQQPEKNISHTSLHSIDDGESDATMARRPAVGRNRTTSIQILDKWFSNLSTNQHQQDGSSSVPNKSFMKPDVLSEESIMDIHQLSRFYTTDFDSLSIKDLREMKTYYDILCQDLLHNGTHESNGKIFVDSRANSIHKIESRTNSMEKLVGKTPVVPVAATATAGPVSDVTDLNSKAESIDSGDKFATETLITSSNNSL
ncbi:hypothetical protein SBY92_004089 [Candida maltosa Xu316]|uniref:VPS9 domain-containing protein n=1 Tax=Candida maltosa (strain Xu316) TaxID=1245528 RepID=M3IQL6_CANMX|nr:hypothetical protein G210_0604 [Candida maltosa Xu316]